MKRFLVTSLFLPVSLALMLPAGAMADARTNPPTIQKTSPLDLTRGLTTEVKVEGINLAGATGVLFDDPAITGKILHVNALGTFAGRFIGSNGTRSTIQRGDPPPLNQVTMEVKVAPDAKVGLYRFRLVTKQGATGAGTFSVEPYYGARPEMEPNDVLQEAMLQEGYVYPPAIITGTIGRPGDVDYLPFEAAAGEELVVHITSRELGSKLRWSMELLDAKGVIVARRSVMDGQGEPVLAYRIPADGKYFLAISDIESGGGRNHFYRLKIGQYPYLTSVYPLGVTKDTEAKVSLRGYNLGGQRTLTVSGKSDYESMARKDLRPDFEAGVAHNELKLAVGRHPEIQEREDGAGFDSAMRVAVPVTVNGRVSGFSSDGTTADEDYFRFWAKKGQEYVMEVEARRLGSPLDSVLEILDDRGELVPQLLARAELKTEIELRDHSSSLPALRLMLPAQRGFEVGDYTMLGQEILRIAALPRGPDDGTRFESFGGRRIGYFNTTPEARALGTAIYKVSLHRPDAKFQPNGLPRKTFYYRNDDGGPGLDKDSLIQFTAPSDGEYVIRLHDLRGQQGDDFAYRLTIRHAEPDFQLAITPAAANVPRGGGAAITVTALRRDGFDGPIEVEAVDLPEGLSAGRETIVAGETSTVLTIWARAGARLDGAAPLKVTGSAKLAGERVVRVADADDGLRMIVLTEAADIQIEIETPEVVLAAGGKTKVAVRLRRANGFAGRVPISVLDLPLGVRVTDVGLNGVLITEAESRREFTLEALPWVKATERMVDVTGTVETRSPIRPNYAAKPFKLKVVSAPARRAERAAAAAGASTADGR